MLLKKLIIKHYYIFYSNFNLGSVPMAFPSLLTTWFLKWFIADKDFFTKFINLNQFQTGTELEIEDQAQLLEWFANNYKTFGTTLQIVTDKSQEGSQFCKGFGGIGGLLFIINF